MLGRSVFSMVFGLVCGIANFFINGFVSQNCIIGLSRI